MYEFTSQNGSLGAGGGPRRLTLNVPSLMKEIPMLNSFKVNTLKNTVKFKEFIKEIDTPIIQQLPILILTKLKIIRRLYFTDPPFGDNIMYSEIIIFLGILVKSFYK